jgi:hypothetical protein
MKIVRTGMALGALVIAAGCAASSDSGSPNPVATFDWQTGCPAFEAARIKAGPGILTDDNASKYREYSRSLSHMVSKASRSQAESIRQVKVASDAMLELKEMYRDPSVLVQPEILEARDKLDRAATAVREECKARGYPLSIPTPDKTFVAAPGDPVTHVLQVKLHDVFPLDVYEPSGAQCVTTSGDDVRAYKLTVQGPDEEHEFRELKSTVIPDRARLLADGTCEANMTIEVPYAPRYKAGVGMAEHGATNKESEPDPVWKTQGSSQKITVQR